MADLITEVRGMIGDAGSAQYTDQHIQDVMDRKTRYEVRYTPLTAIGTISPGGTVKYLTFAWGSQARLEGTAVIYDGTYGTITPSAADYNRGWFDFAGSATPPYGPQQPVYITGAAYSLPLTASFLLEEWAGSVKTSVDYSDPSFNVKLSQQYAQLMSSAMQYRSQAGPITIRCDRDDTLC